jgi:hypothetical protein
LGATFGKLIVITVDGDTGGVVSTVFEPFESFKNDGNGTMRSDIADNPAHT